MSFFTNNEVAIGKLMKKFEEMLSISQTENDEHFKSSDTYLTERKNDFRKMKK